MSQNGFQLKARDKHELFCQNVNKNDQGMMACTGTHTKGGGNDQMAEMKKKENQSSKYLTIVMVHHTTKILS